MSRWQRAGTAVGTAFGGWMRRQPARLVLAGVAGLLVLALTWAVAVASVSGSTSSADGVAAVAPSPGWAPPPGSAAEVAPDSEAPSDWAASAGSSSARGAGSAQFGAEGAAPAPELGKRIAVPPTPGDPSQPVDMSGAAPDRAVVRTARLELTVGDVAAVSGRLRSLVAGVGGFVAGEQSADRSAHFTLRIPAPRLDEMIGQLAGAGKVTLRSEQADDVTDQVTDLDGRLATQRAGVARLRALLEKANSVGDVVMIESELTQREADLESLQRRLAAVSGRVAMSTLTVSLTPVPAPDAQPGHDGFLAGLAAGWRAFLAAAGAGATVLGAVLPFLAPVALLAALGLAARRLLARRRQRPAGTPDGA